MHGHTIMAYIVCTYIGWRLGEESRYTSISKLRVLNNHLTNYTICTFDIVFNVVLSCLALCAFLLIRTDGMYIPLIPSETPSQKRQKK